MQFQKKVHSSYNETQELCISLTDINRSRYSRMDQVKFVEDSLQKILLGPFLNALTHIYAIKKKTFQTLYKRQCFQFLSEYHRVVIFCTTSCQGDLNVFFTILNWNRPFKKQPLKYWSRPQNFFFFFFTDCLKM